ncbi:MAG TPA: metal ABC transporter substrate-binding protein [Myxococcota bacterium]|nr:metal ABC transporter substrate-binding protein [Myxococcota bacterium]
MLGRGALALALAALAAAWPAAAAAPIEASRPLRVVATIEPLCMLARELTRERVSCTTLVPPGASPHAFEPRPSAMAAVARADLLLRAGNEIDDWAAPLAGAGNRDWVELGPACKAHDSDCAHFWLDPYAALAALAPLEAAFAARDPSAKAALGSRRIESALALFALDEALAARFARLRGAAFISFHPSWGGFATRYGLVDLGAVQAHGAEEPTPRHLAELIRAARTANVRVVLVEPQQGPHVARIVAEELGARVVLLDPLGHPNVPERASYPALMEWNARRLAAALGEDAP